MSKRLGIAALCLLLGACVSAPPGDGDVLYIHNKSSVMLRDVSLEIQDTGGVVSCEVVAPKEECSLSFGERKIQGNDILVSWEHGAQSYCQPFTAETIEPYTEGPLRLYFDVKDNGDVDISME